jgi:hypothetical protein
MPDPTKPGDPDAAAAKAVPEPIDDHASGSTSGSTSGSAPGASGSGPTDRDRVDRGITDFVRRAVSAGVGAASRSKDDIMRAAATEVRSWLDHLDINSEVLKVLSRMVIEVKTEIRFRPNEDGKLVPETTNDVKMKPGK